MFTKKMLSVVVLCYKDESNIKTLYERLTKTLNEITTHYEILYINDASPDNSEEVLRELAAKDPRLTVISHARNFGPQAGFTTGMQYAMGDAVILMDGDLQDPPELIAAFVEKWKEGCDVVYGVRSKREKSASLFTKLSYFCFYRIFRKLSYLEMPIDAGEFSLMDRKVVDHINALPECDRIIRGLRAWVGFKQVGVEYVRPERHSGKSSYTFTGYLRLARNAICAFSYKPLEWISYLAIMIVMLSFVGAVYIIIEFFTGSGAARGITTLLVLTLFVGGIQLLSLAIIAEYIGRIFEEVKGRPTSIVKEVINDHHLKEKGLAHHGNEKNLTSIHTQS